MLTHIGPASAPMAFLSDIHGNLPALEAVLAELAQRAVVDIYVAGDLLLGGEQPLEVWQRLSRVGAHCVQGVSDAALASIGADSLEPADAAEREAAERFGRTQAAVGELVLRQLAALPKQLRIPMIDGSEILLVHGSPGDPTSGMSHDMDDQELEQAVRHDAADVVVCGSTHVPFMRDLGEVQVVNVGSVGEAPGGRIAHYTVITPKSNGADAVQDYAEY